MQGIREIPIEDIKVGEHEQRLKIGDDEIDGLAVSIRRIGVLVPLIVEKKGVSFQLVSGHRRLLAAIRVGLSAVPCIIKNSSEINTNEVTFAENFFRKDLSAVELSAAIADCVNAGEMSISEIAAGFHKSEHWVQKMVAICGWPADVQQVIHEKILSVSAASNLALVTDDNYRSFLVRNAVEQGATARTTAAWLQAWRAMQSQEEAITSEPVAGVAPSTPLTPQAPCFFCGQVFAVNEMSHVPMCGGCIKTIRQVGSSG